MARFEVFENRFDADCYLLDVQADLLRSLNTRVVVPLLCSKQVPKPITRLNPVFMLAGQEFVMMTQFMSAVSLTTLGAPVATLADQDTFITAALDFLFGGI